MRLSRKTPAPETSLPKTGTSAAVAPPIVDTRNLVLCDANGIEHARIKGSQDFRVTHDGVTYEHCATDDAGRWHYRPML